ELLDFSTAEQKDLSNKTVYDFVLPEYHARLKKRNKEIIKGKEYEGVEFKITDKKGNIYDIESKSNRIFYKGKPAQQAIFRNISERKTLSGELEQSKKDFRLILNNIDEIVYYYDKGKNKLLYISSQIEKILGVKTENYLKDPGQVFKNCHPDDIHIINSAVERIRKTKKPYLAQYRIKNIKTNKYVWLEERIFPQFNEKGYNIGNLGVSRDITREREKELKLSESESKFRLLAENATDIVFYYNFIPNPHYSYVSPAVYKILGYTPQDFYDDPYIGYKIIHPEDIHVLQDSESNVRNKKEIKKTFELLRVRYITKRKKTVWLETRFTEIRDGKKIIALEGISRDITAQQESEHALLESERTLSNLLSNLPGMAFRCNYDEQWTMKFISDGCIELTGYSPKELIENKKISFAELVHSEDRDVGSAEIEKALKQRGTFEIEYRIIDKKGNEKWALEKGGGVFNGKGELLYVEGFITDITKRKTFEQELNQQWSNYKATVDNSPNGILIHVNGKVMFANRAALEISGFDTFEELSRASLFDLLLPEYRKIAMERVKRTLSGEKSPFYKYKAFTAKNEQIEVEVMATAIMYNGQKAIQIIANDLSAQQKLEHEVLKTQMTEEANR
ncbi:MAG TPA: PAS domain S-box protein, partial [Nitrosopumilaceae archaeon]|nr:PAS domain S-box protein [Nitrosopumilaceae archaeon]